MMGAIPESNKYLVKRSVKQVPNFNRLVQDWQLQKSHIATLTERALCRRKAQERETERETERERGRGGRGRERKKDKNIAPHGDHSEPSDRDRNGNKLLETSGMLKTWSFGAGAPHSTGQTGTCCMCRLWKRPA